MRPIISSLETVTNANYQDLKVNQNHYLVGPESVGSTFKNLGGNALHHQVPVEKKHIGMVMVVNVFIRDPSGYSNCEIFTPERWREKYAGRLNHLSRLQAAEVSLRHDMEMINKFESKTETEAESKPKTETEGLLFPDVENKNNVEWHHIISILGMGLFLCLENDHLYVPKDYEPDDEDDPLDRGYILDPVTSAETYNVHVGFNERVSFCLVEYDDEQIWAIKVAEEITLIPFDLKLIDLGKGI